MKKLHDPYVVNRGKHKARLVVEMPPELADRIDAWGVAAVQAGLKALEAAND